MIKPKYYELDLEKLAGASEKGCRRDGRPVLWSGCIIDGAKDGQGNSLLEIRDAADERCLYLEGRKCRVAGIGNGGSSITLVMYGRDPADSFTLTGGEFMLATVEIGEA